MVVDLTADEQNENKSGDDDAGDGDKKKGAKQPRRTRTGGKRRRTMGDLELEREDEEGEDSRPRSSFHTQTLTQMPSWKQSGEEEDVDDMFLGAYDDDLDKPVSETDVPVISTPPSKKRKRPSPPPAQNEPPPRPASQGSAILQTPAKQRMQPAEIPSSQPSPFTPNLAIERRGWSPLAQGIDRTPLKNKSSNVGAPTPSVSDRILKRTRSEIPDSWSTVNGGMSSTPSTKRTPLKDITPWGGGPSADAEAVEQADVAAEGQGAPTQRSQRPPDEVIVDSEDEFDELEEEVVAPGTPSPASRAPVEDIVSGSAGGRSLDFDAPTPVSSRHAPGLVEESVGAEQLDVEEQHDVEEHIDDEEGLDNEKSSHAPLVPEKQPIAQPKSTPQPPAVEEETDLETPSQRRRRSSSSSVAEKETPLSSPQKTSPAMPPVSQLGYKSQGFESQRVPFEVIRQMAPQTDRSDVILSIDPKEVKEITEGTKTHEFRDYKIPQTVARIWIYTAQPVCQLKYMATISEVKLPGQISSDDPGIGNKEFNEGKGSKFAYELKQVYQLNNPVPLSRMKENGWVEEAPVKYEYVPPAVLGELMGNLQRALFLEPGEAHPTQHIDPIISQELEEQLRTDIAHSTQLMRIASSPRSSQIKTTSKKDGNAEKDMIILSSQDVHMEEEDDDEHIAETPARSRRTTGRQVAFAKSTTTIASASHSQLSLVEDSPLPRVASQPSQRRPIVRPSQATTASASSPSQRLASQLTQQGHQGRGNNIMQQPQPLSDPVSPSPPRTRTPETRRNHHQYHIIESSSSDNELSDPPQLEDIEDDDDDDLVVDDSPVAPRTRRPCGDDTQSTLGLGMLGSSSQMVGGSEMVEQDSLMDDSRIRRPPSEIAWDSDGEGLE